MSAGAFGYIDLTAPTPQEKLEEHVLHYPNDLIAVNLLNAIQRIESLEREVSSHASVVNMHQPLG
jgi:hypothetical protein